MPISLSSYQPVTLSPLQFLSYILFMKKHLKPLLQKAISRFGATLISHNQLSVQETQRLTLLREAAALYRPKLKDPGAVGIVFSFNRPVQLHALLASYFHYAKQAPRLIVQYRATPGTLADDIYNEVKELFKNHPVTFVAESTCRGTLLEILAQLPEQKLFFLVDDDVFIRPVNMDAFTAINPLEYIPSLRMGAHLRYSYTMKMEQPPPALQNAPNHPGMLTWNWGDAGNEWAYPFSVEGHLFDTAEIVMMTRATPFKAPNTYEGLLMTFAPLAKNRPGLCYPQSKLLNIPCNKVQLENDNHAGETHGVSPEEFLARWQSGEQINPTAFETLVPNSTHQEVPFTFIKRPGRAAAVPAAKVKPKAKAAAKKASPVKKAATKKNPKPKKRK